MSLNFAYDKAIDVFTIEGVKWAGELLRAMGVYGFPSGAVFRIERRDDDIVSIKRLYEFEKYGDDGQRLTIQ